MAFWCYMLRCADGRYYTGHTDNLDRRIGQHQTGGYCKFTSTRLPVELVWSEYFPTRLEALEAERIVGGWSRAKKEALIRGDWTTVSYFARPPRERVSTKARSAEACPERLPWQAVDGLDTNGGGDAKRASPTSFISSESTPPPFVSSEVERRDPGGISPAGLNTPFVPSPVEKRAASATHE